MKTWSSLNRERYSHRKHAQIKHHSQRKQFKTALLMRCFNQLFEHSFWRHPFTAEDPSVSKWRNAVFLQICSDEETNSSTSWMAWRRVHLHFWITNSFNSASSLQPFIQKCILFLCYQCFRNSFLPRGVMKTAGVLKQGGLREINKTFGEYKIKWVMYLK